MKITIFSIVLSLGTMVGLIPNVSTYERPPSNAFYCAEWREGSLQITGAPRSVIEAWCNTQK